MLETMLLLAIILILGLMAIGYLIEVGGIFAWIGWGAVLVCCALFFYFSGMYPRRSRRVGKLYPTPTPGDSTPLTDAGWRFKRGKRGRP